MENNKRKYLLDLLPIILTTVIAISACFSTYFSYQAIKIASEQKRIQSRQEILGYIKTFLEMAAEYSKKTVDDETIKVDGKANNLKESTKNKTPNKSLQADQNR